MFSLTSSCWQMHCDTGVLMHTVDRLDQHVQWILRDAVWWKISACFTHCYTFPPPPVIPTSILSLWLVFFFWKEWANCNVAFKEVIITLATYLEASKCAATVMWGECVVTFQRAYSTTIALWCVHVFSSARRGRKSIREDKVNKKLPATLHWPCSVAFRVIF